MNSYPEPKILRKFSEDKLPLAVRYAKGIGFEFEVRFDLALKDCWRQPYTGAQADLEWEDPKFKDGSYSIESGAFAKLDKQSGALSVAENGVSFMSVLGAFAGHDRPVEIFEGINSLKMTDMEGNTPPAFPPTKYMSRMLRFQYARPSGAVLGLPGQTGEFDRNGYRFELYNTDTFVHTPARPPMYQSWPIVMHETKGGWCAIFFDNPSRTFVDVGELYQDRICFEAIDNNLRVYVILGKNLAEVSRKLVTLLGLPPAPPRWAFGYQQSRWSYMNSKEVRSIVGNFKAEKLPLHGIYFDIDYMHGFRVFTTNKKRFPDLSKLIRELDRQGVNPICILDPGIKIDKNYSVYREFKKSGAYLKDRSGAPLVAEVWPGDTILPDFGNPRARELWTKKLSAWLKEYPLAGVWNDMNEPSNFDGQNQTTDQAFTSRGSLRRDHNLYGYWMAKASAAAVRDARGDNGLVITRAGYPGVQQFAVLWHGDNQCWWEHLRLGLRTAVQYSLCGMFFTGPDLPGFTGNAPDDLAVRFFQLGAFLPFFRGHSWKYANNKEPYAFGAEAKRAIKRAVLLRESMLDEWHNEYLDASLSGKSPLMPVFTSAGELVPDQFTLFDRYLVAPVLDRGASRRLVYLPKGRWQRCFKGSNKTVQGGDWVVEAVSLDTIPYYKRV